MFIEKYLGKTLRGLSEETHIFCKPIRVFFLSGPEDPVGQLLAEGFSIKQILQMIPASEDMVVKKAENYYGETILRVGTY